jgi:arginyl-tRNA synthetase
MNVFEKFRQEAAAAVSRGAKLPKDQALALLENPPEGIDADLAFPCFTLAGKFRKSPAEIAKDLADSLRPKGMVSSAHAAGPYVNFRTNWGKTGTLLIKDIIRQKNRYGSGKGKGKRIMVEFAHPNTHKAFHIGHVRNIALGESLSRVLAFGGHEVTRANYQGDIGPHVARCLWGLMNLKLREPRDNKGMWLGEVYRKASNEATKPEVDMQIRQINRDLYAGKPSLVKLWKETREWSLDYFDTIYGDFGAKFDRLYFESEVENPGVKLAKKLLDKDIAKFSDGAIVMDLKKHGLGIYVLVTQDGTPLYSVKDFVLAEMQDKEFRPERVIHVVGSEQNLHFRQLFRCLETVNPKIAKKEFHLSYGLVNLESGKMKSREGKVILYEDLKEKLLKLAQKVTREKNPKLSRGELESTARTVALGALKYDMIKVSPEKTITFDWDRALSFDGDTAPYVQYTHARACSILRKGKAKTASKYGCRDVCGEEKALLKLLAGFPDTVGNASRDLRPHYVANYCCRLAKAFNEFYQKVPVLKAKPEQRAFRLTLVKAVSITIRNGLYLLGIEAPEKM